MDQLDPSWLSIIGFYPSISLDQLIDFELINYLGINLEHARPIYIVDISHETSLSLSFGMAPLNFQTTKDAAIKNML